MLRDELAVVAAEEAEAGKLLEKTTTKLIFLIDQLEELFTLEITEEQRVAFFKTLELLATSGDVLVLATLRSDFYHRCAGYPALMKLKQGAGQYHLAPDICGNAADDRRAGRAGRREVRSPSGHQGRAVRRPAAARRTRIRRLPLLQYALEELYRIGHHDGVLNYAEYESLGQIEGALTRRAEKPSADCRKKRSTRSTRDASLGRVERRREERITKRVCSIGARLYPGAAKLVAAFERPKLLIADNAVDGQLRLASHTKR